MQIICIPFTQIKTQTFCLFTKKKNVVPKRTHRLENNIWFTFPFVEWFGWFQTLLVPLGKCLPTCNFAAFFPRSTFISMKMFAGCDGTKHVKTLFWNWVPKKQSECPKNISIASQVAAIREKSCEKNLQKNGCQSPCSSLSSLSSYYIFLSFYHYYIIIITIIIIIIVIIITLSSLSTLSLSVIIFILTIIIIIIILTASPSL
jgi:hypothetical protein